MATHESKSEQRFPPEPREEDVAMVLAESPSYQEFDQWMDLALESLVARWIHSAAPNANRVSHMRERCNKKSAS